MNLRKDFFKETQSNEFGENGHIIYWTEVFDMKIIFQYLQNIKIHKNIYIREKNFVEPNDDFL